MVIKSKLYMPRHWPVWIMAGLLFLIIQLPYKIQLLLGKYIGLFAFYLSKREKNIALINLEKCFPDFNSSHIKKLLRKNFISTGQSLIETAFSWWASTKRLKKFVHIKNLNAIKKALENKKGALIFTPHFTSIHAAGRLANLDFPFAVMYFPPKNPVIRYLSERALPRCYSDAIPRNNAKLLLRALKQNKAVFYTPDIDAGKKGLFVPFFNILASTVTATIRFAQLTQCAVIPASYYRRDDNTGINITFHEPLENFPDANKSSLYRDMLKINLILETFIREHPEHYLWQYKRFKTRPIGEKKFYATNSHAA